MTFVIKILPFNLDTPMLVQESLQRQISELHITNWTLHILEHGTILDLETRRVQKIGGRIAWLSYQKLSSQLSKLIYNIPYLFLFVFWDWGEHSNNQICMIFTNFPATLLMNSIFEFPIREVPSSHPVNSAKCWTFSISDWRKIRLK